MRRTWCDYKGARGLSDRPSRAPFAGIITLRRDGVCCATKKKLQAGTRAVWYARTGLLYGPDTLEFKLRSIE